MTIAKFPLRTSIVFLALLLFPWIANNARSQDHSSNGSAKGAGQAPVLKHDGSHDFDFLIGKWHVHFRVLLTRLSGGIPEWVDYNGTEEFEKLFSSNASFDEYDAYSPQLHMRNKSHSLRLYDVKTGQWSIYQLNNEGILDAPVIGQFTGNHGEFRGQDTYNGRAIYVRNVWLNISPKSARWEQSWSADGGKTWEVNWINELSRQ